MAHSNPPVFKNDLVTFDRFLEADIVYSEAQAAHEPRRKPFRPTTDTTFDQATSAALRKLTESGVLLELGDCISSGKDASVFVGIRGVQAEEGWPPQFAIKIRSAVLKFNPADGLYRSEIPVPARAGFALPALAKTEYRSLTRLYAHGIPCPCPLMVHKGLLLMELISDGDAPAQTLADAELTTEEYEQLYPLILIGIRRIFHRCAVVRADMSEHTILVRQGKPVWVGAARVVERESESASMLLRRGIAAITKFFQSVGVRTVPLMRAFQFVITKTLNAGFHETIEQMRGEAEQMSADEFVARFAPCSLADVTEPELAQGLVRDIGEVAFNEEEDDSENMSDDEDEEEEEEDGPPRETLSRRQFTKEEWKAKVREIKVANRERRHAHKPQVVRREQKRRGHRNAK